MEDNTAAKAISPSLNVVTAMEVLISIDFCPTYLALGELCHITECKDSFAF